MCMFCETRKADSKEDALPLWVRKHVADGDAPFHHWEVDNATGKQIRGWQAKGPDFKVKRVCQSHCNSGWMSRLEGDVEPFLGGLIKGRGRTLHRDGQRLVAFWAIKTAMTWQYSSREQPIPVQEAHRLYAERESRTPPSGWQVWIGSVDSPEINGYHCPARVKLALSGDGHARGYASTFAIGHVVFQVFGSELGDRAVPSPRDGTLIRAAMLPIWPYIRPATLPPTVVLDLIGLEEVARAVAL